MYQHSYCWAVLILKFWTLYFHPIMLNKFTLNYKLKLIIKNNWLTVGIQFIARSLTTGKGSRTTLSVTAYHGLSENTYHVIHDRVHCDPRSSLTMFSTVGKTMVYDRVYCIVNSSTIQIWLLLIDMLQINETTLHLYMLWWGVGLDHK